MLAPTLVSLLRDTYIFVVHIRKQATASDIVCRTRTFSVLVYDAWWWCRSTISQAKFKCIFSVSVWWHHRRSECWMSVSYTFSYIYMQYAFVHMPFRLYAVAFSISIGRSSTFKSTTHTARKHKNKRKMKTDWLQELHYIVDILYLSGAHNKHENMNMHFTHHSHDRDRAKSARDAAQRPRERSRTTTTTKKA